MEFRNPFSRARKPVVLKFPIEKDRILSVGVADLKIATSIYIRHMGEKDEVGLRRDMAKSFPKKSRAEINELIRLAKMLRD